MCPLLAWLRAVELDVARALDLPRATALGSAWQRVRARLAGQFEPARCERCGEPAEFGPCSCD